MTFDNFVVGLIFFHLPVSCESISCIDSIEDTEKLIKEISVISEKFEIDFIIGLSIAKEELTDYLNNLVTVSL